MTNATNILSFERARNPLASAPGGNFKEHFDKFCVPTSLRECMDQYRVDRFDAVMRTHGLVSDDLWLTTFRDVVPYRSFSEVFDPFAYFDESGPVTAMPDSSIKLPPVPAEGISLVDGAKRPAVQTDISRLTEHMKNVPTEKVLSLAFAVAAYYLDENSGLGGNRAEAIRYIALNDIQSSSREFVIQSNTASSRTRRVTFPDMVERRKADFRELFTRVGMPIDEREFECMPLGDIIEYAADQRAVLLGHNRHIVFCTKCAMQLVSVMSKMHQNAISGKVM